MVIYSRRKQNLINIWPVGVNSLDGAGAVRHEFHGDVILIVSKTLVIKVQIR